MRLWVDQSGAIIDDGRVIACLARHGSLSAALEDGDIKLIADTGSRSAEASATPCAKAGAASASPARPRKRLADYLES